MQIRFGFDEVKSGKLDELVNKLVGGVWGLIERNQDKEQVIVSLANHNEWKPAITLIGKYLV